ncbi:MAG: tellurite resistance TerB family protein [Inquilinus sp.]|uniref:tellurite resistance TerB family protein n=1 Tax=Inquilinus sp. TaxID=1932117 RepID=UPI003F3B2550
MNLDKLLGALAQSGMGRASGGGLGGGAGGVDIGGILSQVLGGGGTAAAPAGRSGGGMGGLGGLLEGLGGGGSSGGGLGSILGSLGGQGGGGLGGGMGGGLMAIIASIAMQALQNRGGGAASLSAPPASASNDVAPGAGGGGFLDMADSVGGGSRPAPLMGQNTAHRVIRTMIAAAAADGTIDEAEATAIQGHLGEDDAEERAFIEQELSNPATPEQLADGVSSPQEAAQVYTAALLTVTMDSPEESRFLKQLALALGLDAQTIASLHQTVRQGQ